MDENAKWAGTFLGMHSSLLVEPRRRRRRWWGQLISGIVHGQVQQSLKALASHSASWQVAWNSHPKPQEIPAICHPYKITFSIQTVVYRQSVPTGNDT